MTEKGAFPPGQEPALGPVGRGRGQACCTSCLSQPLPSLAEARAGTGCLERKQLNLHLGVPGFLRSEDLGAISQV